MHAPSVAARHQDRQEAFWACVHRWAAAQVTRLLEVVLLSEQQELIAAGWNERSQRRSGWRNGFYRRRLTTPQGLLHVRVPRCRHSPLDCSLLFDRYQRRVGDVERILRHAFLLGASTRGAAQLAEQIFGGSLSHQTVSRMTRWLDGQLALWRQQTIEALYKVVYVDGMHVDVIGGHRNVMLVAGLRKDGQLDVLGFCVSTGEQCRQLLQDLRRRGLEGVELFVSDESAVERAVFGQLARWRLLGTYTQ